MRPCNGFDCSSFGVQYALIGVVGRMKRGMDMDVARKMSVKILGSPDLLETIGLCRFFRGSLNTP